MLRLKYLIPLLIFLFVCVFLFVGLYLDPRKVPSALIDKPAPEFSLPTMSGETVTKKDLLGKVYLLNVWATRWLQVLGNPYDVVLVDASGKTAIDFGVYGAPETFVIDKKGVIRYKVIGPMTEEVWKKDVKPIVDMLEKQ